jgi:transglutaminase-like putative cysteine protease
MRFAQVHKVAIYSVAVLGLLALASGDELQGPWLAVIAAGVIASWWAEGALLASPRYARVQTSLLLVALAIQSGRVALAGHGLLDAAVEFSALLQVSRLAYRRSASEFQQSAALSLAHLIAATVLGAGLSYALCFIGFVITLPWALTLGHLRREIEGNYLADARAGRASVPIDVARILRSRRVVGPGLLIGSSLLSLPIFAMTAVLFVAFPRIGLGAFSLRQSRGGPTAGLGDEVDLSGHGTIRDDPTIVLRIEPSVVEANPSPTRPFRLRGAAFDGYNGRAWSRRSGLRSGILREGNSYDLLRIPRRIRGRMTSYRITLDALDPPVMLLPPGSVRVQVEPRIEAAVPRYPDLTRDGANEVRYAQRDDLGIIYTAFVPAAIADDLGRFTADRSALLPEDRARYLQLPPMSDAFVALAHRLTDAAPTALDKAAAVERYLKTLRYTLTIESGGAERPIEHFLFTSRAGHCEYFSTAMALLLRAVDVPTRNVTGFLGGSYNRYGRFYAIRQSDAHSWVEVHDERLGWVTFDPTPSAREAAIAPSGLLAELDVAIEAMRARWRQYIVGYDLSAQTQLFRGMFAWMNRGGSRGAPSGSGARGGSRGAASSIRLPSPGALLASLALTVCAVAGLYLFRSGRGAARTPVERSIREAQALAHALDAALSARGHARPSSRSPLAHAQALARARVPIGVLALEIAERWAAARYGAQPLGPDETARYRRALERFEAPPG